MYVYTFKSDVLSNFAGLGRLEGSGSTQRSITCKIYSQCYQQNNSMYSLCICDSELDIGNGIT